VTLVLGSAFHTAFARGSSLGLHPTVTLAVMLALELAAVWLLAVWSRRAGWRPVHALAAAAGAVLTYGWLGISRFVEGRTALGVPTTAFDVAGQVALLLAVTAMTAIAGRRLSRAFPVE
jgi:hypothetical protein